MHRFLLSLGFVICGNCLAETNWLTVMGDRSDPLVDTIEVDPTPVSTNGEHRVMQLRVSRSIPRTNWDGIPYRSYRATAEFDCANKTAEFQQVAYYAQPVWAGEAHKTAVYTKSDPRPMRFRGVSPNPVERIIRAACRSATTG